MAGYVQEVTKAGKHAKGMSDVVGVRGIREHEGGLKSRSVGEGMS